MRRISKWFARRNSQIICVRTRRHEQTFIRTYVHVRGLFGSEKIVMHIRICFRESNIGQIRAYVRALVYLFPGPTFVRTYVLTYVRTYVRTYMFMRQSKLKDIRTYVRSFVKFWSRQESET